MSQGVSNEIVKVSTAVRGDSGNLVLTATAGRSGSETQCNKGLHKKDE